MPWVLIAFLVTGERMEIATTEEACRVLVDQLEAGYDVNALYSDGSVRAIKSAECRPMNVPICEEPEAHS